MSHWAPHLTAAANSVSTRSTKVNQLHKLQRIRAKVTAPTSILGDDMPDNEDTNAERAKYFKWAPPAFITCLSSLQHDTVMTFPFDDISLRLVDIVVLPIPRHRYSRFDWATSPLQLWPFRARCARRPLAHLLPAQWIHQRRTRAHFVLFRKGCRARRFHHAPPQRHLWPWRTEGRLADSEHQPFR